MHLLPQFHQKNKNHIICTLIAHYSDIMCSFGLTFKPNTMKYTILLTLTLLAVNIFAQAPTPTIPMAEITHEMKNGSITTLDGTTLEGLITFNEYGNRTIYLYQEGKEAQVFDDPDALRSMTIEGRGTFEPIFIVPSATEKIMALLIERTDAYTEYKLASVPAGLLGVKTTGGSVNGSYNRYLINHRNQTTISEKTVKNLKKSIRTYLDYCDEIATKVEDKKKGFKVTLMSTDYELLKHCIAEAALVCPHN